MPRLPLLAGLLLILLSVSAARPGADVHAVSYILQIDMYGDEQVPPVDSIGHGFVRFFFNEDRTAADYTVDVKGFGAPSVLGADIHRGRPGENGPVIKHLAGGDFIVTAGKLRLTEAELAEMASGDWYVSLKTRDNPAGEFRGQIELPADFFAHDVPFLTETAFEPLTDQTSDFDYAPLHYDSYEAAQYAYLVYEEMPYEFWTAGELSGYLAPGFLP